MTDADRARLAAWILTGLALPDKGGLTCQIWQVPTFIGV